MVIFSCQYGQDYYRNTFGFTPDVKYVCSLLGTKEEQRVSHGCESRFRLISCSTVNPIKNVERIAQALALVASDISIEWVHIGDGQCFEQLERTARKLLTGKGNVSWRLAGGLPHEQVLEYYRENPWDCFITTSLSEGGCPVSIQEAMSFGVPIIGTAVGGITEMLTESENILLSVDAEAEEVAEAIERMHRMSDEEKDALCHFNRCRWEMRYDAEKNSRKLVEQMECLWEDD